MNATHVSAKCSLALHCLLFIQQYSESMKVTSQMLARSTGANPATIRSVMSALGKAGIVSVRKGSGGATISEPLDAIDLYRVCEAVEPEFLGKMMGMHPCPSLECPIGRRIHTVLGSSYERIGSDLQNSMQSISLADIRDDYLFEAAQDSVSTSEEQPLESSD